MDEKPKKPVALTAVDSTKRRPSLIISIGQQRYEVGVKIDITPLRNEPAEVIFIDRTTPVQEAPIKRSGQIKRDCHPSVTAAAKLDPVPNHHHTPHDPFAIRQAPDYLPSVEEGTEFHFAGRGQESRLNEGKDRS